MGGSWSVVLNDSEVPEIPALKGNPGDSKKVKQLTIRNFVFFCFFCPKTLRCARSDRYPLQNVLEVVAHRLLCASP